MNDWMIEFSVGGKSESEQICLCSGDSGRHLDHCSESDAILYTEEDEIFIERLGETPVEIERSGRKRRIQMEHPTRILTNDAIRVGLAEYRVRGIYRIHQPRRMASYFGQFANKILLTSAAAILLAVVPACKPTEPSNQALTEPPKCENGEAKLLMCLNNNRYEKCGDGHWKLVEECKKPSFCSSHNQNFGEKYFVTSTQCENSEPCKNGKFVCYDLNEIYKCEDHQWKLQEKCATGDNCEIIEGLIFTEAKCVKENVDVSFTEGAMVEEPEECEDGELKCDSGNALMYCTNGFWDYKEVCKNNEICKQISPTNAVCVSPDAADITDTAGEPAEPVKDGAQKPVAVDVNAAEGGVPSPVVDEANTCEDGKKKCSDDHREIYICDHHAWKPYVQCYGDIGCKQGKPEEEAVCDYPRIMGKVLGPTDCSGKDMRCDTENVVQDCMMGHWHSKEKCIEPFVCKEESRYKATCVKPDEVKPEE